MAVDYTKRSPAPEPVPPTGQGGTGQGGGGKVTLTKSAPSVSLTKRGSAGGTIRVNLRWRSRPQGAENRGFFKRLAQGPQEIDLDLACLYELTDGTKGVVQALGNAFTSQQKGGGAPIIRLDGDDRSGSGAQGENLFVDLAQSAAIKRILVFAFIYEGTPNWAEAAAVVTLHPATGDPVEIHLDEADAGAKSCAIALIENVGGDVQVRREVRYVRGSQRALDEAYGWGMQWQQGRK